MTLTHGFWIGKTEVTQDQWTKIMDTQPTEWKTHTDLSKHGPHYPATWVSWEDATYFCERLTEFERAADRLPENWQYCLPTSAQWEYACRAATTAAFSFGDDVTLLGQFAWYNENAWNVGETYAHMVGMKKPNPWGLHDMHGNVYEWCRDWHVRVPPSGTNPEARLSTNQLYRVLRGGCFSEPSACCRSFHRGWAEPGTRAKDFGFRIAAVEMWAN